MTPINKGIILFLGLTALSAVNFQNGQSLQALTPDPGLPIALSIERIGVSVPIEAVGVTTGGDMGIPKNENDVGWYKYGPRPGASGSAVIVGHFDTKKSPQGVFYNLQELDPGDIVEVLDDKQQVFKFKVLGTKVYDYNASSVEVFATSSKPRLNLITCAGDWLPSHKLYNKRIVVFTELVD